MRVIGRSALAAACALIALLALRRCGASDQPVDAVERSAAPSRAEPSPSPAGPSADELDESLIARLTAEPSPERSAVERTEGAEAAGDEAARSPRPGTERWHRERFLAQARADLAAFETSARSSFGAAATLAEDVALLLAARTAAPALAEELAARALEAVAADDARGARLRDAVFELWLRDAARSDAARERLLASVLRETAHPAPLRRRAAFTTFSSARDTGLDRAIDAILEEDDATVRADAMRGLRANDDASAARAVERLSFAWSWDAEVQRIAAEPKPPPLDEDEPR